MVGALALALALATPSTAAAVPATMLDPATTAEDLPPGMLAALQRDLDLAPATARTRLAREHAAAGVEKELRQTLADSFAGAWLTPEDARLVVAITDPGLAGQVSVAGAVPELVVHSAQELDQVKTALDHAPVPPAAISGWYVDVTGNTVAVLAAPGALDTAAEFVVSAGVDADAVRVVAATERPVPLYDLRGGDAYYIDDPAGGDRVRCSIGFAVEGGFVTAGHCGGVGATTSGYNQVAQGTVQGSSFPDNDHAWVAVNSDWSPTPTVNHTSRTVVGSEEAVLGAAVCRSGSTTGWHCGTIEARDVTVRYNQGTVFGLTRTTVCGEGGDSGGSYLHGRMAQGVTSGGAGNCTAGGITFFQPVNEILDAYDLTLVTVPVASLRCRTGENQFVCQVRIQATGPVQIRWFKDGIRQSAFDDRAGMFGTCDSSTTVGVTVTGTYGSDTPVPWYSFCSSGRWPK
jgi:streptogrisin C